jgi:hypothetical protein
MMNVVTATAPFPAGSEASMTTSIGSGGGREVSGDPAVYEGLDETGTARAGQASRAVPVAIEVSHLTKVFGGRTAVSDVSFSVASGEVFGFLGPNGAGKTTTVRMLGTLIAPSSGSAIVAGIPVNAKNGPAIRSRISIMPESPGLYLRLTVLENLECFAGLYELDDVRGRIGRALRAVNLIGKALAAFVPTLVIAYAVFGIFLGAAALFANPVIDSAIYAGTHVLVQLVFTPLLAGWAIWVGIAVSARSADVRAAQQLSVLGGVPPLVILALMSLNVITVSTALALGLAAALLAVDLLAWRVVATMFDRERLVAGRPR